MLRPKKLRGEALSSTVPPLFTENLFRAQKFRLNAAGNGVFAKVKMLAHAPGMVFGEFQQAFFQNSDALSGKKKSLRFPHQRIYNIKSILAPLQTFVNGWWTFFHKITLEYYTLKYKITLKMNMVMK